MLLERYFTRHYEAAEAVERAAFENLLEHEDPEIWLWVVGQSEPPAELAHVIARLRHHD